MMLMYIFWLLYFVCRVGTIAISLFVLPIHAIPVIEIVRQSLLVLQIPSHQLRHVCNEWISAS